MAQQSNRKIARMVLAAGAPLVVAVTGVTLGLTAGPAQAGPATAGNGQPVILGATCSGSGTNCETSPTDVKNTTGSGNVTFEADQPKGEVALYGVNTSKHGTAYGVWGTSSATGVEGDGGNIGVAADGGNIGVAAFSLDGTALEVDGRAQFQQSGVATVTGTAASPKNSVRVRLPIVSAPLPITAKSMMTALLQKHVPGVYVVAAVPNVRRNYFTIYLNRAVTTRIGPIAWMVTERE